jgi:long-chain acyl-CoA synthetase
VTAPLASVAGPAVLPPAYPSVVHMLVETARRVPEREALVCGPERATYADYLAMVATFAEDLVALGARGERVALVLGNGLDICVGTFAAHAAGAQVVPLNPLYTPRELGQILADARPAVVVCEAALEASLAPLAGAAGARHVIAVGPGVRRLTARRDGARLPTPLPGPDELGTLQYTGGTTGVPKGVDCRHGAIALNVAQRDVLVPAGRDGERFLCVMPLYHTYAVAMCLHNAANCGGTLVILPKFAPAAVFELLAGERISVLAGGPSVFAALMADPGFGPAPFATLAVTYSGSSALPEATLRRFEAATGAPVLEGFGQSESGPVLTFNPLHGRRKVQSVGLPLPGTEVEIVDPLAGGRVLGRHEIGEIRVRGPQVMAGYRGRPAETAEVLKDGWLYTGDLGELDDDGYLYVRDRKKAMLLVSGFNVYPREVEEVLCLHSAVQEAAVIGVPDERRGQLVKAFVVRRAGASADEAELDRHCRENLAPYKVPRVYAFVDRLPKTPVGKIDKKQLA